MVFYLDYRGPPLLLYGFHQPPTIHNQIRQWTGLSSLGTDTPNNYLWLMKRRGTSGSSLPNQKTPLLISWMPFSKGFPMTTADPSIQIRAANLLDPLPSLISSSASTGMLWSQQAPIVPPRMVLLRCTMANRPTRQEPFCTDQASPTNTGCPPSYMRYTSITDLCMKQLNRRRSWASINRGSTRKKANFSNSLWTNSEYPNSLK